MRGLRPTQRAVAMAAALVALIACGAAAAPWHAHYERGVKLLRDGEASKAEEELRAALAARPHAGCRQRIYGVKYRDYIPHYELGMALLAQGRESEAAVEFSLEMGDGVIDSCPGTREQALSLREHVARLALAEAPAEQAPEPAVVAGAPEPAASSLEPTAPQPAAPVPPEATAPEVVAARPRSAAPPSPPAPAVRPAQQPAARAASVDPRSLLQLTWSAAMHGPPAVLHVPRP